MRRCSNEQVIEAWVNGKPASNHAGTLTTDGVELLSHWLLIGEYIGGNLHVYPRTASGNYVSVNTSKHVELAIRHPTTSVWDVRF